MGKTALATNIAFNASQHIMKRQEKSSVAFFSLKYHQNNYHKNLSEQSKIKSDDIRRGKVSEEELIGTLKLQEIYVTCHYILRDTCNNNCYIK